MTHEELRKLLLSGPMISVPMSMMMDKRIKSVTRNIYVAVLCLSNPASFKAEDLVSNKHSLSQVKRALTTLRKYGYLPDEA